MEKDCEESRVKIIELENRIFTMTNEQQQKLSSVRKNQDLENTISSLETDLRELENSLTNEQKKTQKLNKIN